jgi:hypothetical protein
MQGQHHGRQHLLIYVDDFLATTSTSAEVFSRFLSNMSVATLEPQRRHRTLLTVRRRGMQKEDGAKLFKGLCFISFCKDVLVRVCFK